MMFIDKHHTCPHISATLGMGEAVRKASLCSSASVWALLALQPLGAADTAQAEEQRAGESTLPPVVVAAPRSRPANRPRPKRTAPQRTQQTQTAVTAVPAQAAPEGPPPPAPQTASQLTVTRQEIADLPISRPAEVLEAVPGLIITQHSGEGKANQYFLRGYNLDHGTDLAIFLDEMPINMRTHGHGQGYADLNFLIPELVATMDVRKGPYFADEGDFSSVGAVHINLLNQFEKNIAQVTPGSFGYQRYLGMGSTRIGDGTLLYAGEFGRYNGPWDNPDDM